MASQWPVPVLRSSLHSNILVVFSEYSSIVGGVVVVVVLVVAVLIVDIDPDAVLGATATCLFRLSLASTISL